MKKDPDSMIPEKKSRYESPEITYIDPQLLTAGNGIGESNDQVIDPDDNPGSAWD